MKIRPVVESGVKLALGRKACVADHHDLRAIDVDHVDAACSNADVGVRNANILTKSDRTVADGKREVRDLKRFERECVGVSHFERLGSADSQRIRDMSVIADLSRLGWIRGLVDAVARGAERDELCGSEF